MKLKALLALSDGKIFEGFSIGESKTPDNPAVGEVVFNTSLYGYQDILSDPSYAGQILCFTSVQIGNVGTNKIDWESDQIWTEGIIIRNYCYQESNFRSEMSLDALLKERGVMGIYGIDTRALVQHLRDFGSQMGAIAVGTRADSAALINASLKAGSMLGKNYVPKVTCKQPYNWSHLPWDHKTNTYPMLSSKELELRPHIVVLDCGVKQNILRMLVQSGFRVTVVPASSSYMEIAGLDPDGLFLSNGPGDPATLVDIVATVKECLGKFPIFGICLGHQILSQAVGGKTYKLKFGHRGGNHPVIDNTTGKVEITCQNHGFAVDGASLPSGITVSHTNLNDKTVEGLDLPELKAFSVQYHPEASPGPHDSAYLFGKFQRLVIAGLQKDKRSKYTLNNTFYA